jgi:sRNA-binding carbon storage regulator CsrA
MPDGVLVLARKRGERVVIRTPSGEVIEVLLLEVAPHKARLGFRAAPAVAINRSEVDDLIQAGTLRGRPLDPADPPFDPD